jgi:hypothetical protein
MPGNIKSEELAKNVFGPVTRDSLLGSVTMYIK